MQGQNKARTTEALACKQTNNTKKTKRKQKLKMQRIEINGDNHNENIVLFNGILLLARLIKSCYQNNCI